MMQTEHTNLQRRPMITAVVMLLLWLGVATNLSQAGVIPSVTLNTSKGQVSSNSIASGSLTLSLYQLNSSTNKYDEVTDTWLPSVRVNTDGVTVTGTSVYVVVNSMTSSTAGTPLTLAANAITMVDNFLTTLLSPPFNATTNPLNTVNSFLTNLTTSHYRGICTNFGSNTDTSVDYTFAPIPTTLTVGISKLLASGTTVQGYQLTPTDCGGMAVLRVTASGTTATFIVPQDSLPGVVADGIPQAYQNTYPAVSCTLSSSTPSLSNVTEDKDCTPLPTATTGLGDGFSNFDEARGFIVSGSNIQTDWRRKDFFVHLVNPQCGTSSLLVQGASGSFFPPDGTSLFQNVFSVGSSSQVHLLGYKANASNSTTTEWVDNFVSFTVSNNIGTITYTSAGSTADRQINLNALYPVFDTAVKSNYQKGLRLTECVDTSATSPVGTAGWGSANGPDNAVVYTGRIKNYINGLIKSGGNLTKQYSSFNKGAWTTPTSTYINASGSSAAVDATYLISKTIQFYIAMELGHAWGLTVNYDSTYGNHCVPGTGDNLDQTITNTADTTNKFFIPGLYGATSQANAKLNN